MIDLVVSASFRHDAVFSTRPAPVLVFSCRFGPVTSKRRPLSPRHVAAANREWERRVLDGRPPRVPVNREQSPRQADSIGLFACCPGCASVTSRMPRRESNPSISDALALLETLASVGLYHHIFQTNRYPSPSFFTPATEQTCVPPGWPCGARTCAMAWHQPGPSQIASPWNAPRGLATAQPHPLIGRFGWKRSERRDSP